MGYQSLNIQDASKGIMNMSGMSKKGHLLTISRFVDINEFDLTNPNPIDDSGSQTPIDTLILKGSYAGRLSGIIDITQSGSTQVLVYFTDNTILYKFDLGTKTEDINQTYDNSLHDTSYQITTAIYPDYATNFAFIIGQYTTKIDISQAPMVFVGDDSSSQTPTPTHLISLKDSTGAIGVGYSWSTKIRIIFQASGMGNSFEKSLSTEFNCIVASDENPIELALGSSTSISLITYNGNFYDGISLTNNCPGSSTENILSIDHISQTKYYAYVYGENSFIRVKDDSAGQVINLFNSNDISATIHLKSTQYFAIASYNLGIVNIPLLENTDIFPPPNSGTSTNPDNLPTDSGTPTNPVLLPPYSFTLRPLAPPNSDSMLYYHLTISKPAELPYEVKEYFEPSLSAELEGLEFGVKLVPDVQIGLIITVQREGGELFLTVSPPKDASLTEGTYSVTVQCNTGLGIVKEGAEEVWIGEGKFWNRTREFEVAATVEKDVAKPIGGSSRAAYYAGSFILFIAQMALDFVNLIGILKFTMAMKLVTKLRYINVDFGHVVLKFFTGLGDVGVVDNAKIDNIILNSRKIYPKYEEFGVPIELDETGVTYYIFFIYIILFIGLKYANQFLKKVAAGQLKCKPYVLIAMNTVLKLHFTIFMTIGTEVGLSVVRYLLHHKGNFLSSFMGIVNVTLCLALLVLTTLDLCYILETIMSYNPDNKRIRSFHKSLWPPSLNKEEIEIERKKIEEYKEVEKIYEMNIRSTAEGMLMNYNIMSFVTMDTPDIESALKYTNYKIAIIIYKLRFVIYQVFMVTLQSFPSICVLLIGLTEINMAILFIPGFWQQRGFFPKAVLAEKIMISVLVVCFCIYCFISWLDGDAIKEGKPVNLTAQGLILIVLLLGIIGEYVFLINTIAIGIVNYLRGKKLSNDFRYNEGIGPIVYRDQGTLCNYDDEIEAVNLKHFGVNRKAPSLDDGQTQEINKL